MSACERPKRTIVMDSTLKAKNKNDWESFLVYGNATHFGSEGRKLHRNEQAALAATASKQRLSRVVCPRRGDETEREVERWPGKAGPRSKLRTPLGTLGKHMSVSLAAALFHSSQDGRSVSRCRHHCGSFESFSRQRRHRQGMGEFHRRLQALFRVEPTAWSSRAQKPKSMKISRPKAEALSGRKSNFGHGRRSVTRE